MKIVDFPSLVALFRGHDISPELLWGNLAREIEAMGKLRHRNIVYLKETFWVEDRLYMCMELVEGKDLLRSIPRGGLPEDVAKGFFFQLCSAVSFCHANNVRHFGRFLLWGRSSFL
jgi:serine/threonine protein kinase